MEPTILVSAKSQLRLTRELTIFHQELRLVRIQTGWHGQPPTASDRAPRGQQYHAEEIEGKDHKIEEIERAYDMTKKDLDTAIDTI